MCHHVSPCGTGVEAFSGSMNLLERLAICQQLAYADSLKRAVVKQLVMQPYGLLP